MAACQAPPSLGFSRQEQYHTLKCSVSSSIQHPSWCLQQSCEVGIIINPIYRWGNWSSRCGSNLPKVMRFGTSGRRTQVCILQSQPPTLPLLGWAAERAAACAEVVILNTLNPEIAVKRLSRQEHRKKGQHSEKLQKPGGPWWQKGNTRDWCPDVLEERTSLSPMSREGWCQDRAKTWRWPEALWENRTCQLGAEKSRQVTGRGKPAALLKSWIFR